jgi:formylglycine-generating enzyme required for sulfatase activity
LSLPLNRRSALSRADLVAALAQADGETPDATTLCLAEALGLAWVQPQAKPRQRRPPKPPKLAPPPESSEPKILAVPLQETLFWQVQTVAFFTEPAPQPSPPVISPYRGWRRKPQHPPQFQPLARWAELVPRLRKALCDYREGRAVDLPLTVRLISQGRLLERFPRERRHRWGPGLMLIEDDSNRLIPYRADKRLVREAIQRLLPAHSLCLALMDEYHEKPEPLDGSDWPPPPGSLVLALGDLGCLAKRGERQRQCWLEIGQELRESGCHAIALFPAPLSRCPPELAAVWRVVPWERPRPTEGDSLEQRAERLLRLVSPAARIEPGLLRSVRLLLPERQADAGTESDVWQHSALSCNSAVAASLIPEQAQTLRLALASAMKAGGLGRLASLIKAWHGHLPEEIWFDELLNLDPDAFDTQELRDDQEDAQSYFAAFCDENPVSADLDMPACDRSWLSRLKARSTGYLWQDRKIGQRLAELALAVDPQAAYLPGIGARDIPHRDQPERRVHLLQTGDALSVVHALSEPFQAGSLLADVTTRNGLIEFEPFNSAGSQAGAWEPACLLRLDTASKATAPLPQARAFAILTDREKLTLRQTQQPEWANSMGRDRFGLWADFRLESKQGPPVVQRLRWIPPGRFLMGSPAGEPGRYDDEGPLHPVTINNGYWLFDTPCTQALWEAVLPGDKPSRFPDPDRPVERVSWDDIQQRFLSALNERIPGFMLPNEAQWEYACRAGTDTALYTGNIEILGDMDAPALHPIAWYGGNSGVDYDLPEAEDSTQGWWKGKQKQFDHQRAGTRKVKGKQPNPWGLYDMLGNVWEWVEDPWHPNYYGAPDDGTVWVEADAGGTKVVRGGSWFNLAGRCRCAYRHSSVPDLQSSIIGFRCARVQA